MEWLDAIIKVLEEENSPLHYTEITDLIVKKNYRDKLGATPQQTVSSIITTEIKKGEKSIFEKVGRGIYKLKESSKSTISDIKVNDEDNFQIINSFGLYWNREHVNWKKSNPNLFGIQYEGADPVNFNEQIGIYLLYDSREIIYVGRAVDTNIAKRLKEHTQDRLAGRWNRFSWFGFYPVNNEGKLEKKFKNNANSSELAQVIEAILIEVIEPRQNRKQGDSFNGKEFLQYEDEEIKKNIIKEKLDEILKK
jgi:hypothetical protein